MPPTSLESTLKRIKKSPSQLRTLREHPQKFAKRFNLSRSQLNAISSADSLVVTAGINPLAEVTTITFTTGTTITAGARTAGIAINPQVRTTTITFTTGTTITAGRGRLRDPRSLRDLTRPQLERLFERVLADRGLADRVRTFLDR